MNEEITSICFVVGLGSTYVGAIFYAIWKRKFSKKSFASWDVRRGKVK